jgi:hypothetical protein
MAPVTFEQIDTEIADAREHEPTAPAPKQSNSAELIEQVLRELKTIEARARRLVAD